MSSLQWSIAISAALYVGDFDSVEQVLAEEFSFHGPLAQVNGRRSFLDSAAGLRPIVKGHRVLRHWVDGDEVVSIYEVFLQTPAASGTEIMSEWHVARNGVLTSGVVLLDTAALRAVVAAT